jgi:DNA-binding transcriptional MerR regulator
MRIGELSARTGVSIRSLRYYEAQGLIAPSRQANGYRDYSPLAVEQVETVKLYLHLGLSTEQIAGILQCVMVNKEAFCAEVMPLYASKLSEIDRQITQLTQLRANLVDRMQAIQEERRLAGASGGNHDDDDSRA